jgi:hypothetical protein
VTPARRKTLTDAIDLIADVTNHDAWAICTEATREALITLGAQFGETPVPIDDDEDLAHFMTLGGVFALCAWDNGEHLLLRWAANARTALAEGTDENAPTEEEE